MRTAALLAAALAACGGSSTTNGSPDATGNPNTAPPDFTTPAGKWTYVAVDGTTCMDGSHTGIGINLGTSGDLVIYLEGGGACFNAFTCASVAHSHGFGPSDFTTTIADYTDMGLFDRKDAKNPLKDATFVFVPYCTGDVHAGSNPSGFGGKVQVGYVNMGKDLDYIVPKATKVGRVILTGSSAGGFGALFNFDRTQQAFGAIPVTMIDDSGPPLSDTYLTPCLQKQMRTLWNLDAAIPADCTTCNNADGGGLGNAATFVADKHSDRRLGLITSTRDGVISSFLGFGYPNCQSGGNPIPPADYTAAITELRDTTLASHANFKVFSIDSAQHVWLLRQPLTGVTASTANKADLETWLTQMLDDDAAWSTVSP